MTEYQFWHGDMRLLEVYRKAYHRNISYTAWYHGLYGRIAVEMGAKNALAMKKSEKIEKWCDWKDPLEKVHKPKTKEQQEIEFRKQQMQQNAWLFGNK